jgi:hypothetical protein
MTSKVLERGLQFLPLVWSSNHVQTGESCGRSVRATAAASLLQHSIVGEGDEHPLGMVLELMLDGVVLQPRDNLPKRGGNGCAQVMRQDTLLATENDVM